MMRFLTACVALLAFTLPGRACPFCNDERGPTLVGEFKEAAFVVFGRFDNPRSSGFSLDDMQVDFVVEKTLKSHDLIKGKDRIALQKNTVPTKSKFLLYADVYKGKIDPYRGVEVQPSSDLISYLDGAMALQTSKQPVRLRYYFDYLTNPEIEISLDAYREFAKADYQEYAGMAKSLPPDTIAGWLRDPKTPPYRYGLYSSLLGHCGTSKHAQVLREMLDDPEKRKGSGIDGILAAYVMIEPKKGFAYLTNLLADGKQSFLMRYAGLRTARFLWEQRPDLVTHDQLAKGVAGMLTHPDMADFAVEDLRKWQRWEMTEPVLKLFDDKDHQVVVTKKAILRFALQSPEKQAAAFVQAQRQRDAEWVSDTELLLNQETEPAATAKKSAKS